MNQKENCPPEYAKHKLFNNLSVSYIYCFFLHPINFEELQDINLKGYETHDVPEVLEPKLEKSGLYGSLLLNSQYIRYESKVQDIDLLLNQENNSSLASREVPLKGTLKSSIKIRESGAGVLTFDLNLEKTLSTLEVKQIADIGEDTEDSSLMRYRDTKTPIFLLHQFADDLKQLRRKLKVECVNLDGISKIRENKFIPLVEKNEKGYPKQYPFPIICATLPKDKFETLFWDQKKSVSSTNKNELDLQQKELKQCLLFLLVRPIEWYEMSLSFSHIYGILEGNDFINYSPFTYFYRNFTHRCAMTLAGEVANEMDSDRREISFHITKEILELIRLKWFGYGIGNLWIDKRLKELKGLFAMIRERQKNEKKASWGDVLPDILEKTIEDRLTLWGILEDPVGHIVGSVAANRLYVRAIELFRFGELEQMMIHKMEQLDRAYDRVMDWLRTKQME